MRLLLVEDDRMIGESLQRALRLEGYAVDWVRDAAAADSTLASERFDLVLLDLGLPPGPARAAPAMPTGSRCCAPLRARRDATPVIVLTARDARGDRVAGLDAGADDYLVKPFELDELNARIRAVLRRHAGRAEPLLSARRRHARPGARGGSRSDGEPVLLSAREFAVLEALLARAGRGAVARAARGPALRLGRGDREQRGLGLHPPAAQEARRRLHPQRARRRLLRRRRRACTRSSRHELAPASACWLVASLLALLAARRGG